jgi:hypothetical protein
MRIFRSESVFLLTLLACGGCGDNDPNIPKLVPVKGLVTWHGKPLAGAAISFIPTEQTKGQGSEGGTDASGNYTVNDRRGLGVGAPVGTFKVVISKRLMPDGSEIPKDDTTPPAMSPARESLPPTYSDRERTTLTATVPEGGGTINFELEKTGN